MKKFVTERAYENPKFVEDMVRDVAAQLNADARIGRPMWWNRKLRVYPNHSAYAMIRKDKTSTEK